MSNYKCSHCNAYGCTGGCGHSHHQSHHHGYHKVTHTTPKEPCGGEGENLCPEDIANYLTSSRSIGHGIYQVLDKCGKPMPHAWVCVLKHGTPTKAPIYDRQNAGKLIANPVRTDNLGRASIYFSGGPVDVVIYRDCNGAPGEQIDSFTNHGGFVDGDFALKDRPKKDCIDIDEPRVTIHNGKKCNIPDFLTTPEAILIHASIKLGLVAGKYSVVKQYYECLGKPFDCGLKVIGDETGIEYTYDCENCDTECPPDPDTVEFDDDDSSPCWTRKTDCCNNTVFFESASEGGDCYEIQAGETIFNSYTQVGDNNFNIVSTITVTNNFKNDALLTLYSNAASTRYAPQSGADAQTLYILAPDSYSPDGGSSFLQGGSEASYIPVDLRSAPNIPWFEEVEVIDQDVIDASTANMWNGATLVAQKKLEPNESVTYSNWVKVGYGSPLAATESLFSYLDLSGDLRDMGASS